MSKWSALVATHDMLVRKNKCNSLLDLKLSLYSMYNCRLKDRSSGMMTQLKLDKLIGKKKQYTMADICMHFPGIA